MDKCALTDPEAHESILRRARRSEGVMRIFALSDLHVDHDVNAQWVRNLSRHDYRDDLLILAGDITHRQALLAWCFRTLAACFRHVLFVPGNHDLWVIDEAPPITSLQKFDIVAAIAGDNGVSLREFRGDGVVIVPLLGWYDYSFGEPGEELMRLWMDFRACRWPPGFGPEQIAAHFTALNTSAERSVAVAAADVCKIITFSHFLPRIDLLPSYIPAKLRFLDPVLGSGLLDQQLRRLRSDLHVYGHSHINRQIRIDGVDYVNNAFGSPQEDRIATKQLLRIDHMLSPGYLQVPQAASRQSC